MGIGFLSRGQSVALTTHPHLASRLKEEQSYSSVSSLGLHGLLYWWNWLVHFTFQYLKCAAYFSLLQKAIIGHEYPQYKLCKLFIYGTFATRVSQVKIWHFWVNPLNSELNPICYLLALLAHHFLHVSRIMVKSLTLRLLMLYVYGAHILDVSRSHTTTQHSR